MLICYFSQELLWLRFSVANYFYFDRLLLTCSGFLYVNLWGFLDFTQNSDCVTVESETINLFIERISDRGWSVECERECKEVLLSLFSLCSQNLCNSSLIFSFCSSYFRQLDSISLTLSAKLQSYLLIISFYDCSSPSSSSSSSFSFPIQNLFLMSLDLLLNGFIFFS